MKKISIIALLFVGVISFDVLAQENTSTTQEVQSTAKRGGKGKKGNANKPTFTNGCLEIKDDAKGPMANVKESADANGDGCITEDEFNSYMENNKPEGKGGKGGGKGSR